MKKYLFLLLFIVTNSYAKDIIFSLGDSRYLDSVAVSLQNNTNKKILINSFAFKYKDKTCLNGANLDLSPKQLLEVGKVSKNKCFNLNKKVTMAGMAESSGAISVIAPLIYQVNVIEIVKYRFADSAQEFKYTTKPVILFVQAADEVYKALDKASASYRK